MRRFGLVGWVSAVFGAALIALLVFAIVTGISDTTASTETTAETDSNYTFVWFSDTQNYSAGQSKVFDSMMTWIADNQESRDIRYAFFTGDVVDDRTDADQWIFADAAIQSMGVNAPLLMLPGNHDYKTSAYDHAVYSSYFGAARFGGESSARGFYEDGMGAYSLLDAGDDKWLFVALGYGIDDGGIDWTNSVIQQYPDRRVILLAHSYLDVDGELTDQGQTLYSEVVVPNANVQLVLCGHHHGATHITSAIDDDGDGAADRDVCQVLVDYQDEDLGGLGYLMVLSWDSTSQTMYFGSYSPYLDDSVLNDDNRDAEYFSAKLG